jgi:hypothetical protein
MPEDHLRQDFSRIFAKALEFDLRSVIARYMREKKTSRERAEVIAYEMLRYLTLCHVKPDSDWTVTGEVDEMWHTFILFTQKYRAFCDSVFGEFVDHIPSEDEVENERVVCQSQSLEVSIRANTLYRKYTQTINDYKNIVGVEPDPTIWPSPSVFLRGQEPKPCDGAGGCRPKPACGCDRPRGPTPVPNCRRDRK